MFSLGYRELIVNENSSVVPVDSAGVPTGAANAAIGDLLSIGTLGVFDPTVITGGTGEGKAPVAAVAGEYTTTSAPAVGLTSGNYYIMKVYCGYSGRVLAEFFPERQTFQYQVVADSTYANFGLAAAAAMFDSSGLTETLLLTGATAEVALDFAAGFEGMSIEKITTQLFNVLGDPVGGVVNVTFTEDVAPLEGVGTGRILEASVKLASAENSEYQLNEFGHDNVIVSGTYKTYIFSVPVADNVEVWKEHEDTGHTIINELVTAKDTAYMIYVNVAAADTIANMDEFITGAFT